MKTTLPPPVAEMSPYAQRTIRRALNIIREHLNEPGEAFTSSCSLRDWLRLHLALLEREEFSLLWLDNQNRLITHETLLKEPSTAPKFIPAKS